MSKEKGVNVQVMLRCRPFSDEELRTNAPQVVTCNDYQREVAVTQNIAGKQFDRIFTFDKVFGPSAMQKDLYDQEMVPIVNEVLEGFNCTIFAYGQTGTGKTFTMEGDCKRAKCGPNGELPPGDGVIPRAVKQIFDMLESQNAEYSVKVTFLELYNEEITDLLAPEEITKMVSDDKQKKQLPLMEYGKGGVLVRGLEEEIVTSANEIFTLLERGSAKRRTAETLLNKQSSRSHSLFSITIHIKESTPEGEELIKCGKLNLVDLAGSENISRSGAREGRAREAGEINKSLLTLGRVINALVEHLGHVPYRDSKLTRLLRDSLGGRTKTCIIATVSPAVLCLEETLSTLDYAHRAKNIRNKPEVNQKMMKSTLIKDLYAEIDRLKAEVHATREKNGVYIPTERYYKEEKERKDMANQIEQMTLLLDTNQKQLDALQDRFECQIQICLDLSAKLDCTEKNLVVTQKELINFEEELKRCRYSLKEKDFILSEQKKAENAIAYQACVLQSELDKSVKDNAALFSKIDREDMLSAENRATVNAFQAELAQKVDSLRNTVSTSISKQTEHLQTVEKQCRSFTDMHQKTVMDLTNKVAKSRSLCASHIEAIQNIVRLHVANSNSSLEEISSCSSSNAHLIEEFLDQKGKETDSIFDDLQSNLSAQQGEVALFANELRKRFHASIQQTHQISDVVLGFVDKLMKETQSLGEYATKANDFQMNSLTDFQKVFQEQSKSSAKKLIDDVTNLLNDHVLRQNKLVDARISGLKDAAFGNKAFLDKHVSVLEGTTADAKRKWQEYSEQSENDCNEGVDLSTAKHCRVEQLLQQCINTAERARSHWKGTQTAVTKLNSDHIFNMASLARNGTKCNEGHNIEVDSARIASEDDIGRRSKDLLQYVESLSDQEQGCISEVLDVVQGHASLLQNLQDSHAGQATSIVELTHETFEQRYLDYETSGTTPTRIEPDVPSKKTIESLRALPMETLSAEFRDNNPCHSISEKKSKVSLIPRAPLNEIN